MGVTQASVLDPLLFLIYINDLQNCLKSIPRLFADDTAFLTNASSICELEVKINEELSRVFQWMNKNCRTIKSLQVANYNNTAIPITSSFAE